MALAPHQVKPVAEVKPQAPQYLVHNSALVGGEEQQVTRPCSGKRSEAVDLVGRQQLRGAALGAFGGERKRGKTLRTEAFRELCHFVKLAARITRTAGDHNALDHAA